VQSLPGAAVVRLEEALDRFGDAVNCTRSELMDSIAKRVD
jgi:hypothetical protein